MSRSGIDTRFWSKVEIKGKDDCWLWKGYIPIRRNRAVGYGVFKVNNRNELAHRVAYKLTFEDVIEGKVIMHKCDNPSCCNPSHLFAGTVFDNNKDKLRKGRHKFGGLNPRKLTDTQAEEIRTINPKPKDYREVGKKYNVSRFCIYSVINKKGVYK